MIPAMVMRIPRTAMVVSSSVRVNPRSSFRVSAGFEWIAYTIHYVGTKAGSTLAGGRTRYLRSMNSMRYPSGSRTKKIRVPLLIACGLLSKSTPPTSSSLSARASRSSTAKATWL
jgi:hypothetical protein